MAASVSSKYAEDDVATVSDINVTPLVDVVLVLLIVFMITMPAIVGAAQIKIDVASPGESVLDPVLTRLPLNFHLRLEGNQQVLYLEQNVADDAYLARVARDSQPIDEQPISLTADKGIPYGDVVKVMDRLAGFGLQKVSLNIKASR